MKLKYLLLPVVALACLSGCSNNVPKESSKFFEGEEYYALYYPGGNLYNTVKKGKTWFYVFKDEAVYTWSYKENSDDFTVSVNIFYAVRGDVLFTKSVGTKKDDSWLKRNGIKYGDKNVYNDLASEVKEQKESRSNRDIFRYFGDIDYGTIHNDDSLYATFEVSKDLGYVID